MEKNLFVKIFAFLFTIFVIVLGPLLTFIIYTVDRNNGSENDLVTNVIGEWLDQYFNTLKFDFEKNYDYQIIVDEKVENPIIWDAISSYDESISFGDNISNYLDGYLNNSSFEDEEGNLHTINNINVSELGIYSATFDFTYNGGSLNENMDSDEINEEELTFIYRFTTFGLINKLYFKSVENIIETVNKDDDSYKIGELDIKSGTTGRVELSYDNETGIIDVTEYNDVTNMSKKEHASIVIQDEYKLNPATFIFFQFWIDDGTYSDSFIESNHGARTSTQKTTFNWIRKNGTWIHDWNTVNADQSVVVTDGLIDSSEYIKGTRQTLSFSVMGSQFGEQFVKYIDEIYGYGKKGLVFVIKIVMYISFAITSTLLILILFIFILLFIILSRKSYKNIKEKIETKKDDKD